MGVQVRFSPGHDIYYLPGRARPGGGGERTAGGYYVNAAIAGEPPGRWFGTGAAALGLAEGDEVDPAVHEQVFSQVDPCTGGRIGRGPARDTAEKRAARSPAAKPEDQATPGGREQIRDMPGPLQQALLGLGITSPSLLARGADLDRASERLLIEAADELPSTQQRPPAATLNMTAGSATLLNHALASGNPQAARLVHQAGQAEREDPEPEP